MKTNRYLLCILFCGFMLYYAVPRLTVAADGIQSIFSIAWLAFALIVLAGNLTAFLYAPKGQARGLQKERTKKKIKSFH